MSERHCPPTFKGGMAHDKPIMTGPGLRPVLQRWNLQPMLSNPADRQTHDPRSLLLGFNSTWTAGCSLCRWGAGFLSTTSEQGTYPILNVH